MINEERVKELDVKIYAVYRKAYETDPGVRLDPDKGLLGELWRQWDLIQEEG